MLDNLKQKHPKGLYLLFCLEMWERFSYYGMRALIVLYMVQKLAYSIQTAGRIYGFYTGFVYLTPLIGGYLADKYFGQRKCISTGALLMMTGLFLLAFGSESTFLLALFLMIIANGLFKSNISSLLGLLYGDDSSRKDSAFTIFYMGINIGAFLSPLICGTLAVKFGYEYGFASAGIGMLLGFTAYKVFENKYLGQYGLSPISQKSAVQNLAEENNNKKIKLRLTSLFILMLFTIPFWVCFEQAGSSLTLFAEDLTNRNFLGYTIPTEYFQSLNPLFIIVFAPLISLFWEYLRKNKKEPTSVEKFAISFLLMTIAYTVMSIAGFLSAKGFVSMIWLISGYFIMTLAELCISPIGLSLVSKLAPRRFLSLTMGCWFLTSFFGNMFAGFWGGKFGSITPVNLFIPLAILSFTTFIIIFMLIPKLNEAIKE